MKEKTSLEKSHSAWSNTKLTFLCIVTLIFVSVFWGTLILKPMLATGLFFGLLGGSAVLTAVCLFAFRSFKR